ncbi:hypothetical protein B0H16DRAFT_1467184 [Mycena metata]|uniref:Uncharacterized protein n=1 Tax=Mycena metata TaxID=1033252 RepID=A0AAD7MXP3_9AGAR|nr:hypothetical protein B0H16DRAFT_1467184 [Mycena metata]
MASSWMDLYGLDIDCIDHANYLADLRLGIDFTYGPKFEGEYGMIISQCLDPVDLPLFARVVGTVHEVKMALDGSIDNLTLVDAVESAGHTTQHCLDQSGITGQSPFRVHYTVVFRPSLHVTSHGVHVDDMVENPRSISILLDATDIAEQRDCFVTACHVTGPLSVTDALALPSLVYHYVTTVANSSIVSSYSQLWALARVDDTRTLDLRTPGRVPLFHLNILPSRHSPRHAMSTYWSPTNPLGPSNPWSAPGAQYGQPPPQPPPRQQRTPMQTQGAGPQAPPNAPPRQFHAPQQQYPYPPPRGPPPMHQRVPPPPPGPILPPGATSLRAVHANALLILKFHPSELCTIPDRPATTKLMGDLNTTIWASGAVDPNSFLLAALYPEHSVFVNTLLALPGLDLATLKERLTAVQGINSNGAPNTAFAVRQERPRNFDPCTTPNCPRPNSHSWPYCTHPGGGMGGKSIREAQHKACTDQQQGVTPPTPPASATTPPAPSAAPTPDRASEVKKRADTGRMLLFTGPAN